MRFLLLRMSILTLVALIRVKFQPNEERIVVPRKVEDEKFYTDINIKF